MVNVNLNRFNSDNLFGIKPKNSNLEPSNVRFGMSIAYLLKTKKLFKKLYLDMENKLDVLTRKLYEEGIDKANQEAEKLLARAREDAAKLIADAEAKAKAIQTGALAEAENLKKKAESEMALSARQAITALKQAITNLISGKVAGEMAKAGFKEEAFVQEMLVEVVKKWDVTSGNLDLEMILSAEEKDKFQKFVATKYKELLDKGLEVKVGNTDGAFVIQPKDGSYQIAFSEELFESFFNQYMRSFTKGLLYQ